MNIKEIITLRKNLLELEETITLKVESNSGHANNRRELARSSLSSARYHLHELMLDLQSKD